MEEAINPEKILIGLQVLHDGGEISILSSQNIYES